FAIDNVLGHIGDARDGVAALSATVNDVTAAGRISPDTADHLREQLTKLAAEVQSAWDAAVAGDDVRAAAAVHRALSTQADLDRWVVNQAKVQKISAADATTLRNLLGSVERELSGASAGLVGAVATLVPPTGERLPGDTVRVEVRVENLGTQTLRSITSSVQAPAGWTVTPTGVRAGSAAPGATVVHAYDVTVPQDARPGSWPLSGSVSYTLQSSSARLPVSASLLVGPPVVVDSVSLAAPSAHPGDTVELEATLTNRTAFPRTGTLQVDLPDGWTDPEPATFAVAGSGSTTVTATVEVPLSVTQGAASIVASIGDTDLESRPASLDVTFVNPPGVVLDHVDLGVGTAETAHGLTASQSSGTNVEAGLTRRYTNSAAPGGWFEFDLAVPKGEPFILRSVETYDQAQFKTYDVLVDGITVEQRRYRRTAGGMASLSYQFVVDEAAAVAATEDGVVRVRYQDVDADYDPSIADVWATPVMAGLDG
ncbi:MAG TPA: NEW3 domain-containing protein, partial [Actinomycetes bacterium]